MTRSTVLVFAIAAMISAAGYAVQHPAAKLKVFATLPHPTLKPFQPLYTAPNANDVARALAQVPDDRRGPLTKVYEATGNRLLWTSARLAVVNDIAADAAQQGL